MKRSTLRRCVVLLSLALATGWLGTAAAPGQEEAPPAPPLTIEEVVIEPAAPTAETLCRLKVKIANGGSEFASTLRFRVEVGGRELPVYRNQLFMEPLAAGKTGEVGLFNFWVTETGRPAPADGVLRVEVALVEAQWMKIETDDEGVEVWTPIGPVPNLPTTGTATVKLAPAKRPSQD